MFVALGEAGVQRGGQPFSQGSSLSQALLMVQLRLLGMLWPVVNAANQLQVICLIYKLNHVGRQEAHSTL